MNRRYHRKGIVSRRFIQKRVADVVIDLYAMAATLSRTDRLIRRHGLDAVAYERLACTTFVETAWRRVRRNTRVVDFEADAPLSEIARTVYDRGGYESRW